MLVALTLPVHRASDAMSHSESELEERQSISVNVTLPRSSEAASWGINVHSRAKEEPQAAVAFSLFCVIFRGTLLDSIKSSRGEL